MLSLVIHLDLPREGDTLLTASIITESAMLRTPQMGRILKLDILLKLQATQIKLHLAKVSDSETIIQK